MSMLPQPPEGGLTEEEISAHQAVHAKDAPGWMFLMFYLVPGPLLIAVFAGVAMVASAIGLRSDKYSNMLLAVGFILLLALTFGIGMLRASMMPEVRMVAKDKRILVTCKHAATFVALQLLIAPFVAIFIVAVFIVITTFF